MTTETERDANRLARSAQTALIRWIARTLRSSSLRALLSAVRYAFLSFGVVCFFDECFVDVVASLTRLPQLHALGLLPTAEIPEESGVLDAFQRVCALSQHLLFLMRSYSDRCSNRWEMRWLCSTVGQMLSKHRDMPSKKGACSLHFDNGLSHAVWKSSFSVD